MPNATICYARANIWVGSRAVAAKNKYLQENREAIIRLVDNGVLLVEKRGNVIRIRRSDLNTLIEMGKLPADIMSVLDVAGYLHIHKVSVYRLVAQGKLRPFKVGRVLRFYRNEVTAMQQHRAANGRRKRK